MVKPMTLKRSSMVSRLARMSAMTELLSALASSKGWFRRGRRRTGGRCGVGLQVDRGRDPFPEALLRIDAEALEVRLHEVAHRLEMSEEHALRGLNMLDGPSPLGRRMRQSVGVAA